MRKATCQLIVLVLFAAGAVPLRAEGPAAGERLTDLPLEDLLNVKVYAASKFVQDLAHAPSSVSIVTADEIRSHGYRTLADVLRSVRGFYVSYDRNYSYVGVRGFSRPGDFNGRMLLLVNGHRLNDNVFEQALVGTESPIDIALVDRVEVIRGPSSSLYGTSAFFAVVNVMTRAGRSVDGVEIEGGSGSQGLRTGRVSIGTASANGIDGLVSVTAYDTRGNRSLAFPEFAGAARDADGDRTANAFGSASFGALHVQAGLGSRTKTIPTAAFGTIFGDTRTQTRDRRGFADLEWSRALGSRATVHLRGAYDHYDYDGAYAYDTGLFEDAARGRWISGDLSVVRQFTRHGLTAGIEYQGNLRQDQTAHDETGVLLDDRRSSHVAGLYVEDEVRLSARLAINAGVRWDRYFNTFGGTVNPRVGVIVTPGEGSALKALYGRAFRAPTPFELYYDQNALSARLQPEHIATYEVAWEQRVHPAARVTATVFHNRVTDLITQREGSDTIDGLYFHNADSANATGVELEVQVDLPGRARGRVTHAVQSARGAAGGDTLSNSPRQMGSVVVDAPLARSGWLVGFNAYRLGERRGVSGVTVDPTLVADITLSRPQIARRLGVAVSLRNVFGADYSDPGSVEHRQALIPQDGRTFGVRATWHF